MNCSTEAQPAPAGMSTAGIQQVKRVFQRQISEGQHPGAQLVVLRFGQVVLDLADGFADLRHGRRVSPETPFLTWSVSKAFTGMCIHRLIEEGVIEWDAPVAE
ncbi:MAG TPA: serine hydrolase domain-containing protein, partial [Anaerolineales bacterium]